MGRSIASWNPLSYCCSTGNLDSKGSRNFVSFVGNHGTNVNFKGAHFVRLRSLRCNLEGIDFEERTSPSELRDKHAGVGYMYFLEFGCIEVESSKPFRESVYSSMTCAFEVKKEIEQCYKLIRRLHRGVVYLGSSRLGPDHPHYKLSFELGKEIAILLDCTSWSGAGQGLMDAVTKGALQAGKPVGGFKIAKEAGEWVATDLHPYLPTESYLTCRFFSARKHGLADAAVRATSSDRTGVVALPGGIGTLDEVFEILTLIQLERIGSRFPVPFLLMNYDSFYSKLLDFLSNCEGWGTISHGEIAPLWKVCNNNSDALSYLAEFYGL